MSKAPQNLKKVLTSSRKAVKVLDEKINEATKIKNLLTEALKEIHKLDVVNKAILSTNLFLMENTILSLEANRIRLRQQILKIVAVYQSQRKKKV